MGAVLDCANTPGRPADDRSASGTRRACLELRRGSGLPAALNWADHNVSMFRSGSWPVFGGERDDLDQSKAVQKRVSLVNS